MLGNPVINYPFIKYYQLNDKHDVIWDVNIRRGNEGKDDQFFTPKDGKGYKSRRILKFKKKVMLKYIKGKETF